MNGRKGLLWGPLYEPFYDALRTRFGVGSPTAGDRILRLLDSIPSEPDYTRYFEHWHRHLTALKRAGYLTPHSFPWTNQLMNVPAIYAAIPPADVSSDFLMMMELDRTNQVLTIYCRPEKAAAWRRLIMDLQVAQ